MPSRRKRKAWRKRQGQTAEATAGANTPKNAQPDAPSRQEGAGVGTGLPAAWPAIICQANSVGTPSDPGAERTNYAPPATGSAGEGGDYKATLFGTTPHEGYTLPKDGITNKDIRLLNRAIANGWNVRPEALAAFPLALEEIVGRTKSVPAGKPQPQGLDRYQAKTETRIKAIDSMIRMTVVNQQGGQGESGGEMTTMMQTIRSEQRRKRCMVIGDREIAAIISAHSEPSDAPKPSGNGNGKATED